jgi:hypothetical protein
VQKERKICKKKHETECRRILESIYHPYTFPSVRPDFLKNPATGRNLEIDCFNNQLKIGLEYQGFRKISITGGNTDLKKKVNAVWLIHLGIFDISIRVINVYDVLKHR